MHGLKNLEKNILQIGKQAKEASRYVSQLSTKYKNEVLCAAAQNLLENKDSILKANEQDIKENKDKSLYKSTTLYGTEHILHALAVCVGSKLEEHGG